MLVLISCGRDEASIRRGDRAQAAPAQAMLMIRCSQCGEVLLSALECSRGICAPCHLFAPPLEERRAAGQPLSSRDQRPSGDAAPGDAPERSGPADDLLSAAGDGGDGDPITGTPKSRDPDGARVTEKSNYLRCL
jgi:hypothetical protein